MGVYIPNMEKPKGCLECWSGLSIDINCEAGAGFWNPNGDRIPPDCPLIEIDDEWFKKLIDAYVLQQIRYGERRSDEHNT